MENEQERIRGVVYIDSKPEVQILIPMLNHDTEVYLHCPNYDICKYAQENKVEGVRGISIHCYNRERLKWGKSPWEGINGRSRVGCGAGKLPVIEGEDLETVVKTAVKRQSEFAKKIEKSIKERETWKTNKKRRAD